MERAIGNQLNTAEKIHILLIEPNEAYVVLFRNALDEIEANYTLEIVQTGLATLDNIEFSNRQRVDFIVMDLVKGGVDGFDVITHAKRHISFTYIPVIILGPKDDECVYKAYNRFANAYITKPEDKDQYKKLIQQIWHFWTSVSTLSRK